jgi:hypothetical protein
MMTTFRDWPKRCPAWFANKPLLASVFILAAPTATMAAPMGTVHAALIAVDTLHGIAVKKVRAKLKPMPAPKAFDDPNYLKGTNIPVRTEAPAPGSS